MRILKYTVDQVSVSVCVPFLSALGRSGCSSDNGGLSCSAVLVGVLLSGIYIGCGCRATEPGLCTWCDSVHIRAPSERAQWERRQHYHQHQGRGTCDCCVQLWLSWSFGVCMYVCVCVFFYRLLSALL